MAHDGCNKVKVFTPYVFISFDNIIYMRDVTTMYAMGMVLQHKFNSLILKIRITHSDNNSGISCPAEADKAGQYDFRGYC